MWLMEGDDDGLVGVMKWFHSGEGDMVHDVTRSDEVVDEVMM